MYFTAHSYLQLIYYGHLNPTKIWCIYPLITSQYRIPRKHRNSAETGKFRGSAENFMFCRKLWSLIITVLDLAILTNANWLLFSQKLSGNNKISALVTLTAINLQPYNEILHHHSITVWLHALRLWITLLSSQLIFDVPCYQVRFRALAQYCAFVLLASIHCCFTSDCGFLYIKCINVNILAIMKLCLGVTQRKSLVIHPDYIFRLYILWTSVYYFIIYFMLFMPFIMVMCQRRFYSVLILCIYR